MPNPIVLDVIENAGEVVTLSVPAHVRLARYTSTLLSPVTVSVPLVLLVAFYHKSNLLVPSIYASITLFFLSLGPLVYILLGVRLGKLSDVDVSHRTERRSPFLFGLGSITIGLFVLGLLHGPKDLETVLIGTAVSGVILMVITWWWKISIHAATLGGVLTMLTALYGIIVLPIFVLLLLVSWSRIVLNRHTLAQVVGGSLMGIILTLVIIIIRGIGLINYLHYSL